MKTTLRLWRSRIAAVSPSTFTLLLLWLLGICRADAVSFSAVSFYGPDGANPAASLTLASNGNFYGTTAAGGVHDDGTVFLATHANALTTLASFDRPNTGAQPLAPLTQGTDGNLYGTASVGGDYNKGTFFMVTPAGLLTKMASFNGTNGATPSGQLVQANGNFYGIAQAGGTSGNGTVFIVSPIPTATISVTNVSGTTEGQTITVNTDTRTWSTTVTNSAKQVLTGASAAEAATNLFNALTSSPFSGLSVAWASSTSLILRGTTGSALTANLSQGWGTLTLATNAWGVSSLASFNKANGAQPVGNLVLVRGTGTSITLYGTTALGGAYNSGTIFSLVPNRGITLLYSFTGGADGATPESGLMAGVDGFYYGTTSSGTNSGTLFYYSPSDNGITNVLTFDGTNGAQPYGPLIQGSDTNLYGTTFTGGTNRRGIIFRVNPYDPTGTFTNLHDFAGQSDGSSPYFAGLTPGTNGNYYGVASGGGKGGVGTLYEVSGFIPFIITAPAGNTYAAGSTVSLSVSAGGSMPLSYYWLKNSTKVLADGSRISGARTPTLTISNVTSADAATYTAVVQNSAGAISNATAVVQVVDVPIVKITSPGQNALVKKASIIVKGTAANNLTVSSVHWQLNGAGWQLGTPITGWSVWAANLTLLPGSNTIQVYALNSLNRASATNTLNLIYSIGTAPVGIQVSSGKGTVSLKNGQLLDISKTYSVTAKPATGYVLSSLTVLSNLTVIAVTDLPNVTFVMTSNLVIQASFISTPFIPATGSYAGLFYPTNEEVNLTNSGFFTATVNNKGGFSSKLRMVPSSYSISGLFSASGCFSNSIPRKGQSPLSVQLQVDLSGQDTITGSVSDGSWTAELFANRNVYSSTNHPDQSGKKYTLIIPGALDGSQQPAGAGAAALKVDSRGNASLSGTLGDGTKVSQKTYVSKEGLWPVFLSLYSGKGSMLGWLVFTNEPDGDLAGSVTWTKLSQKTKLYPAGFAFPYWIDVVGSLYSYTNGIPLLTLTNGGVVILEQGNLAQSITNGFSLDAHSKATGTNRLSLSITTSSGLFKGSVVNAANKRVSFSGALLQKQDAGYGSFLGTNQSGSVFLGD